MTRTTLVLTVALLGIVAVGLNGQTEAGLAELHVQKIVLDPPSAVTRGEDVEIYTRITNSGGRSADSFTIGFFYRPAREGEPWTLLGSATKEHLGPSQQDFLEETFEFPTAGMELGTYEVKVVADALHQIPEVDELNNELITSMRLVSSTIGLPELQPVRLTFAQNGTSEMDPWSVTLEVENTGEYQLSTFKVQFLLDDTPVTLTMLPDPAFVPDTGGTSTIVATLDPHALKLDPGTYVVTAQVDSSDQIIEQDEGNNSLSASLTIQTLELHPQSLRFDKSVVRLDEEVRVTSEIANTGSGIAKNVRVDFYLNHLRFASTQIAELGLDPQEVSVTLDAADLGLLDAPKIYEARVIVDPGNTLHESDEANNELVRTLTILEAEPKKPELHPESLELTPASPTERAAPGTTVTVTSVIINTGRSDAVAFDVGFFYRTKGSRLWIEFPCADGLSCSNVTLTAGAQKTLIGVLPLVALAPGIYEIRVATDPDGTIDELDEVNNELVTTLTVLDAQLADLTVTIDFVEPAIALQQGQTARITATVTNAGEEPADASVLLLSLCKLTESAAQVPGQQVACITGYQAVDLLQVPALGIGRSVTLQMNLETAALDPGQYRIQAEVNPDRVVSERPDLNNTATRSITVMGPDLLPLPATFKANPTGTIDQRVVREVEYTVTVANAGVLASGGFNVVFAVLRVEDGATVPIITYSCQDTDEGCAGLSIFGQVPISGIGAGAQLGVSCTLDLTLQQLEPGAYVVRVYVDRRNLDLSVPLDEGNVLEHSELNNMAELPLVIVGEPGTTTNGTGEGADLSVISVNGRAEPDRILTYGIVKNIGTADSGPFDAEFTVTLPDGRQLKKTAISLNSVAPGDVDGQDGWNSAQFRLGIDVGFDAALAVGESISVTLRIPQVDANTTNNTGTRTFFVKDE